MSSQRGNPAERTNPTTVECWLVGGGTAVLAAVVHQIMKANVPGHHVHIIEMHSHSGHETTGYGNPRSGYTVHAGLQPSFREPCTEHFLSLVPHPTEPGKTLLEVAESRRRAASSQKIWTRLLKQTQSGPVRMDASRMHMRLKDQIDLATFLLKTEDSLGDRSIRQCFDPGFFDSNALDTLVHNVSMCLSIL